MRHLTISILLALLAWPAFGGVKKHETNPKKSTSTSHLDTSLATGVCAWAAKKHGKHWDELTCGDVLFGKTMYDLKVCDAIAGDTDDTPLSMVNCTNGRIDSHECVAPWNEATHPTLGKQFPKYAQCRRIAAEAEVQWWADVGARGIRIWGRRLREVPDSEPAGGVDGDEEP